jgi:hypothetical protein
MIEECGLNGTNSTIPTLRGGRSAKLGPTARESREFHVKATLGLLVALMLFPINGHSAPPSGYVLTFSLERDPVRLKHIRHWRVIGAFLWGEAIEEVADAAPGGFDCAGVGFAHQGLQLGKDLFVRIEVGRVAGQEEQLGAGGADQAAHGVALVAAEIIHDDNVARAQGGDQELLDIGAKAGAVDRPVDDAGRGDAVVAQRRQKGQRAPAALRHLGDQATTKP